MNPLIEPNNQGQYFVRALSKSFWPAQLKTACIEISDAVCTPDGGGFRGGGWYRMGEPPFAIYNGRLLAGQELAISQLMLVGPEQPEERDLKLRVNRHSTIEIAPGILRAHSTQYAGPGLSELLGRLPAAADFKRDDVMDFLVAMQALVNIALQVPKIGFHLVLPQQVRDNDDLIVENLPLGNKLFLLGVLTGY